MARGLHLGRRCLCDAESAADGAGRVETDLVFAGFAVAIFSTHLHHILAGAQAVGAGSGGLSLGQHFVTRRERAAGVAVAETVGRAGGLAGGGDLCAASGAGGIRRLDYRAEKRVVPVVLFAGAAGVDGICGGPAQTGVAVLFPVPDFLFAGAVRQDDRLHAAGGPAVDFMAEKKAGQPVPAGASLPLPRAGCGHGIGDDVVGAVPSRHRGSAIFAGRRNGC